MSADGAPEARREASPTALPDALRFASEPVPGRSALVLRALRHPRRLLPILLARLSGRRLRAAQRFIALVGAYQRLHWPADRVPSAEAPAALAAAGIDYVAVDEAGGIAIAQEGEPIVLLSAEGQRIAAGASAAIAAAFADPDLHALYGDALYGPGPGDAWLPLLRPAFDRDYLRSVDYLGPVIALRRASVAGSAPTAGAAALDLALDLADRFGSGAVRHLPRILSFGRFDGDESVERRQARRCARLKTVERDLDRAGAAGTRIVLAEGGMIRRDSPLPEPHPLVSLIVPTRDRLDLLRPCIESLRHRTTWPAKEILICDNGSCDPATLAYFRTLEAEGAARIVACPGPFDFAGINNRVAAQARGRLLAFINNDVEAEAPDWLERMAREALRPEIGAVGARLIDGEGRIQHGGIVLGTGGLATHGHRHFAGEAAGYLGALYATRSVSAVTAACLVIEADKFTRVGGFDASAFAIDFNDVDLCLRLNAIGLRTLYVGGAVLHHRESASRRPSPEAAARHHREVEAFKKRWGPLLAQDPHYHPGFDPDLSTHLRLRRGWTGLGPAEPR
ncbi:family 2 glycosyl transferase [Methylorubrum populi]|uniref:Family 2 glycosyl transferase n=1 Tax=Methylorubrum populi TaxID=223967 RepID=A0A160PCQ3_9HYPH|nr:glycosyltransferase family 2 protein [Methylorubrum populi]BAU89211.1 family 2 glycosyl transferase [Methylorubrum populi]